MTPDEARDLLDGTTPGPWKWRWDTGLLSVFDVEEEPVAIDLDVQDSDLIAAAPDMARMIAGMREEWGVSCRWANDNTARIEWGNDTRDEAVRWARKLENYPGSRAYVFGIVRRYVTNEEEA